MKKLSIKAAALVVACAMALCALAACSQPTASSSSSASDEVMSVNDGTATSQEASDDPFYVLIVGNDTRTGTVDITKEMYADGSARSDTIMLARVDPKTYLVTFVTIPRDTQDWAFNRVAKINERYQQGGIDELMLAVEQLTGVKPKYYLDTTFVGFQDLINDLGGIHMYVPVAQKMKDIVSGNEIQFDAGEHDLDGAMALVFARERKKYNPNGESYRQTNDRLIVQTIMNKVMSDPATAVQVATKLVGHVKTNWPADDLMALVQDFTEHADQVHYLSGTGPYEGGEEESSGLWVTWRDEETWHRIMDIVDKGGDPNEVIHALSLYE